MTLGRALHASLISFAVALVSLSVASGTAAAAGRPSCPKSAEVVSGTVVDLGAGVVGQDGLYTLDGVEPERALERDGTTYLVTAKATIAAGGVRFTLARDVVLGLSCFGRTKAEGAVLPAVALESGTATVKARAGRPGAIITTEGMYDPYASRAMKITVTRIPKGDPSVKTLLQEGPQALLLGTTTAERRSGAKTDYLNITPYVGPRRGTCRQARGGTFKSTRRDAKGYMVGTASYRGYAPGSPR